MEFETAETRTTRVRGGQRGKGSINSSSSLGDGERLCPTGATAV
jgi:hypothetical protein